MSVAITAGGPSKGAIGSVLGYLFPRASRAKWLMVLLAGVVGVAGVACSEEPFTLSASGPFAYQSEYPAAINPPLQRVAIVVTITNRSGDDLIVNPAEFVARDADHHIYAANATATAGDSRSALVALKAQGMGEIQPLPSITLRQGDVLSGFVAFDLPAGVQPVDLIWRQVDGDSVVRLSPAP